MSSAPWYSRWIIGGAIVRGDQRPVQSLPQYEARSKEDPAVLEIAHCEKSAASTKPSKKEWVMLCFPKTDNIYQFHQVEFAERPTSNAAFFNKLKTEYNAKRTPRYCCWWQLPWARKVEITEVHFIEIRTGNTIPTQNIHLTAKPCLPNNEEGWACNLITAPTQAPNDPKAMASRLRGLKVPREGYSIYDLVPRKLKDPLPKQSGLHGWGLYIVEIEGWKGWAVLCIVAFFVFLAFGAGTAFKADGPFAHGLGVSCVIIAMVGNIVICCNIE